MLVFAFVFFLTFVIFAKNKGDGEKEEDGLKEIEDGKRRSGVGNSLSSGKLEKSNIGLEFRKLFRF